MLSYTRFWRPSLFLFFFLPFVFFFLGSPKCHSGVICLPPATGGGQSFSWRHQRLTTCQTHVTRISILVDSLTDACLAAMAFASATALAALAKAPVPAASRTQHPHSAAVADPGEVESVGSWHAPG